MDMSACLCCSINSTWGELAHCKAENERCNLLACTLEMLRKGEFVLALHAVLILIAVLQVVVARLLQRH